MKRGEIYYITSNYQEVGSEQRAGRPAVIVSNNNNNNNSEVVNIVYLTTQPKNDLPTHVLTRSTGKISTVLCEQVYSVSKQRIGEYISTLNEKEIQQIDIALAIALGLDLGAVQVMREPTEEEMAQIRESVRAELMATIEPPKTEPELAEAKIIENPDKPQPPKEEKPKATPDAKAIKTQAERDLYKKFSEELLEILKGGARV